MPTLSETLWNYLQPRPGSATDELRNQLASLLTGWSSKTSTPGTPKHNANVWLEESARNIDNAMGGPERNRLRAVGPHDPTLDAQDRGNLNQKMLNFVLNLGPQATVWHGSPHKFDKFDVGSIGKTTDGGDFGAGFYFSPDKNIAKKYGNNLYEVELQMRNPLKVTNGFQDINIPEFWQAYNARDHKRMAEVLQKRGFDGVIDTSGEYAQHMVFDPSLIKIISRGK